MHHSGPLPLTFKGPEQGFGGKNNQNASQGKPCSIFVNTVLQIPCWFVAGNFPRGGEMGSDRI